MPASSAHLCRVVGAAGAVGARDTSRRPALRPSAGSTGSAARAARASALLLLLLLLLGQACRLLLRQRHACHVLHKVRMLLLLRVHAVPMHAVRLRAVASRVRVRHEGRRARWHVQQAWRAAWHACKAAGGGSGVGQHVLRSLSLDRHLCDMRGPPAAGMHYKTAQSHTFQSRPRRLTWRAAAIDVGVRRAAAVRHVVVRVRRAGAVHGARRGAAWVGGWRPHRLQRHRDEAGGQRRRAALGEHCGRRARLGLAVSGCGKERPQQAGDVECACTRVAHASQWLGLAVQQHTAGAAAEVINRQLHLHKQAANTRP